MGLWMFFFHHKEWENLYTKNCSIKTAEEWYHESQTNSLLGGVYFILGLFFELIYIPFLMAMLKPEFFKHSCYKLMFFIGIIDMVTLFGNAITAGLQCITGAHFCTNPTLFFVIGCITTFGWYTVSFSCVILAIDRFFEMCFPNLAASLFGGKKSYVWIGVCLSYNIFPLLNVPFIFSTKRFFYLTDPFVGIDGVQGNQGFFELTFHCIHNVSVAFILVGIYLGLVIVIKIKLIMNQSVQIAKTQKIMTLQAMCICIEMFVACLVYVYSQFLPLPSAIEIFAHISWIGVHGDTPIVYLLLNASLRNAVFKMITDKGKTSMKYITGLANSTIENRDNQISPSINQ